MSKELLAKLSELDGVVFDLKVSEAHVRAGTTRQEPSHKVEFYYIPKYPKTTTKPIKQKEK